MMTRKPVILALIAMAACRAAPEPGPRLMPPDRAGLSFVRVNENGYPVYRRAADDMPMVMVAAGEFTVRFAQSSTWSLWYLPNYLMDEHEVTNGQFLKFLQQAPKGSYITEACAIRNAGRWIVTEKALDLPVVGVTEEGALAYARWVGAELPSLAHFEKAAWGSSMKKEGPPSRAIDSKSLLPAMEAAASDRYRIRGLFGNAGEICLEEYQSAHRACVVMGGSFETALVETGTPSHGADAIGSGQVGFRCVIESPIAPTFNVEWRRDTWAAVDEARRRNCIIWATLHWDGCGNCDRYRFKILTNAAVCDYMNEHLVPLVGHSSQEVVEPHHSLPDGRCWVYTGLRCSEHHDIFSVGPCALLDFAMSPGHYILRAPTAAIPDKKDFILVGDRQMPHEGTPDYWINKYQEAQQMLGPALGRKEYLAQEGEFQKLNARFMEGAPDAARIRAIASDARAAYREEAGWLSAELAKSGGWIQGEELAAALERIRQAESNMTQGYYASALSELRQLAQSAKSNPQVLRVQSLLRALDRVAWQRLMDARALAGPYKNPDAARATYKQIIDSFPETEFQKAARAELEALH